jgi:2-polyprenyl-3-methyl-5-hydroxy-6-metoxy-1,4-benzoquinol methylase
MFYGTGECFDYLECAVCGCLQLIDPPKDMSKYYPSTYHTINQPNNKTPLKNQLKDTALTLAIKTQLKIRKKIIISQNFPTSLFTNLPTKTRLTQNSRILEVGCGRGELLKWLQSIGFKKVIGSDPYVTENNQCEVEITRTPIGELTGKQQYDLIILDHSFEHINKEKETLNHIHRLLSPHGTCLIRIPIKTETIWNKYGVNWSQIDAPRHLYLHTPKSFQTLTNEANLHIDKTIFDSTDFQFWASEQYIAGIPLRAENSYWVNPKKSIFNQQQINQYRQQAIELNTKKQGDQAAFYLTKQ